MTPTPSRQPSVSPGSDAAARSVSSQKLLPFAAAALGLVIPLLTVTTFVELDAPFLLASVLLGLAAPALVLTHQESGRAGVRALLRDCVRLPTTWWWLLLAGFGLPILSWVTGAALGGARPLTWTMAAFYLGDLLIGALIINIWEELAWTGYFQRRAASRWGVLGGSLVTSVFFTGVHIPLTFDGANSAGQVATNLLFVAGVAAGLRLLIARLDIWSGGSLLTVGILHSSFNATETVLDPAYDWVRIACTIVLGIGVVAFGKPAARMGAAQHFATPGGV